MSLLEGKDIGEYRVILPGKVFSQLLGIFPEKTVEMHDAFLLPAGGILFHLIDVTLYFGHFDLQVILMGISQVIYNQVHLKALQLFVGEIARIMKGIDDLKEEVTINFVGPAYFIHGLVSKAKFDTESSKDGNQAIVLMNYIGHPGFCRERLILLHGDGVIRLFFVSQIEK
jgi:hypothetical protein